MNDYEKHYQYATDKRLCQVFSDCLVRRQFRRYSSMRWDYESVSSSCWTMSLIVSNPDCQKSADAISTPNLLRMS